MSFAKNMSKIIGKNIIQNLSGKYSQKYFDHTKQSATNAPKAASKEQFKKKTSEATRDLIGNKMEQGQLQMKQKIQKILGL